MTKLNTGLSGCSLELINDRVLRKYSPTTDYNSRLLSQADKQMVFGNRIYKNIDAPKVYDIRKNYFDMEYVCLLYTSPSPRDGRISRMPSSA